MRTFGLPAGLGCIALGCSLGWWLHWPLALLLVVSMFLGSLGMSLLLAWGRAR
jgi:hypothetical protein